MCVDDVCIDEIKSSAATRSERKHSLRLVNLVIRRKVKLICCFMIVRMDDMVCSYSRQRKEEKGTESTAQGSWG